MEEKVVVSATGRTTRRVRLSNAEQAEFDDRALAHRQSLKELGLAFVRLEAATRRTRLIDAMGEAMFEFLLDMALNDTAPARSRTAAERVLSDIRAIAAEAGRLISAIQALDDEAPDLAQQVRSVLATQNWP